MTTRPAPGRSRDKGYAARGTVGLSARGGMGETNRVRGPLLLLAALGLFALLDTNSKLLSGHYPPQQVVGIRYATMLTLLLLARLARPGLGGDLGTRHPWLHLLRAAGMLGSAFGFFLALRGLALAEGYLVYFTAPFFTLALAALFLREPVPASAWGWCALGFGGVLMSLLPGLTGGAPVASYLWALMGTVCYSIVMTINRWLRHEAGMARLILWTSAPGLLVLLPFLMESWVPPGTRDLAALMANGVFSGVASLCLAGAFRHASASRLAPLEFSALAYAVVFDLAIWGVVPGPWAMAGAAVASARTAVVIRCFIVLPPQ